MWKNVVERSRPQMTIWRTRIACWIPKATNTHSEYVIFIACPKQQCLHERAQYYVTRTLPVLLITKSTAYCLSHSQSSGTPHMPTHSICTVHSRSWQPCPPVPHIYALGPIKLHTSPWRLLFHSCFRRITVLSFLVWQFSLTVPSRNASNVTRFSESRKNCLSARCATVANLVCSFADISRNNRRCARSSVNGLAFELFL